MYNKMYKKIKLEYIFIGLTPSSPSTHISVALWATDTDTDTDTDTPIPILAIILYMIWIRDPTGPPI